MNNREQNLLETMRYIVNLYDESRQLINSRGDVRIAKIKENYAYVLLELDGVRICRAVLSAMEEIEKERKRLWDCSYWVKKSLDIFHKHLGDTNK